MVIVVDIVFLAGDMGSNAGGRAWTAIALMADGDEGRKERKEGSETELSEMDAEPTQFAAGLND